MTTRSLPLAATVNDDRIACSSPGRSASGLSRNRRVKSRATAIGLMSFNGQVMSHTFWMSTVSSSISRPSTFT